MALEVGTKLGPYEILGAAGAGGMGEVYRARDTRLDRTVAIKVLSARLADRPDLHKRFEREARTISKLTHPHICTLHDVGQQEGTDFLVMEYLEGETLSHRLHRGPLAPEQTLRYGIEIAEALEAAHRQGVVHRDLKPANVMLTKSGAKLMDFGLAKLAEQPAPVAIALSEMSTQAPPERSITEEGVIVGTFQYMAPEQLEGKEADARTDIFALGMVLYEMATGRPAFTGKTKASVIAAILSSEPPPISSLQPLTPPAFDRVVKTCLAKDPDERFSTAHDLRLQLKWIAEGGSQAGLPAPVVARRRHREAWAWTLAALMMLVAGAAIAGYLLRAPRPQPVVRFEIAPPPEHSFLSSSIEWIAMGMSPDGRYLAFQANDASGKAALWLRPLDAPAARELAAVEGTFVAFTWAPDSRSLLVMNGGKLQRMDVNGSPPEAICSPQVRAAPLMSRGGDFLGMAPEDGPLLHFTADNCTPAPATTLDRTRHFNHMWPYFLPDGRHFLYAALARSKNHEIWEGSLDSKEATLVLRNASQPTYVEPGWLLFSRHGILMAQAFDWKSLKLSGEPVQLVKEQLQFMDIVGVANYDASQTGLLVYQVQPEQRGRFFWLDPNGRRSGPATSEGGVFFEARLSPDGGRMVAITNDAQTHQGDLWLYDFARSSWRRLTFASTPGGPNAVWAPDGKRLAFAAYSPSKAFHDLYTMSAEGGSQALLLDSPNDKYPLDWSADGRFLLYQEQRAGTADDLFLLDLTTHKSLPVAATPASEIDGHLSPDGRWVAYVSDESGRPEVYLQAVSGAARQQVSLEGGSVPRWRADGRELYFVAPDAKLMSAEIPLGPVPRVGAPRALFPMPPEATEYQVARDGRFLVRLRAVSASQDHIQVVVNWLAEVKR